MLPGLPDFPKPARDASARPVLSLPGLRLRPCRRGDLPFLHRLYRQLRNPELDLTGWPENRKRSFCEQQFHAQHTDYIRRYPAADFLLLLRQREPLGRLYVDLSGPQAHLIEIGLLPAWRGQGIGSAVLAALQARAAAMEGAVTLSVRRDNPRALALYLRRGFTLETNESESHLSLRWTPSGGRSAPAPPV